MPLAQGTIGLPAIYNGSYKIGKAYRGTDLCYQSQILDTKFISFVEGTIEELSANDLDGLQEVGSYKFAGQTSLKNIEFPNRSITMGTYAFSNNTSVEEIYFPIVTDIPLRVCSGCTSLHTIHIDSSTSKLDSYCFDGCTSLSNVYTKENLNSLSTSTISSYAFNGCTSLDSITLTGSVTTIGDSAFRTTGLKSIHLSPSITSLGEYVFTGCDNMTTAIIEASVEEIKRYCFWSCDKLSSVSFGGNYIKTIGLNAFQDCTSLSNVSFHSQLKTILDEAFRNTGLVEINLLGTFLESIGQNAFSDCSQLKTIYFSPYLKSIGASAFYPYSNSSGITMAYTKMKFFTTTPPTFSAYSIGGNSTNPKAEILVPSASYDAYLTAVKDATAMTAPELYLVSY